VTAKWSLPSGRPVVPSPWQVTLDDATIATVRRAGVSHEQLEAVAVQAIRRLVVRDAVAALERWHQAHPDYAQLADREYDDALAELA
jgi:hypothetical protein